VTKRSGVIKIELFWVIIGTDKFGIIK
jgi:hypothetical protein